MLLRFGVANHLSLRDHQEISLVASSLKDYEGGLISTSALPHDRVLPAVIIYGANASGKSNLVSAFSRMQKFVLYSHTHGRPNEGVPRRPFRLDPTYLDKPSVFEIDFIIDEARYHYGVEASKDSFIGEWLYTYPKNHKRMLYIREGQNFTFGRTLRGRNRVIADLTRNNSLFLSAAAQNDHDTLMPIYNFIKNIDITKAIAIHGGLIAQEMRTRDPDNRVISFLREIGTGVVGFRKTEEDLPDKVKSFSQGLKELVRTLSDDDENVGVEGLDADKLTKIELAHEGASGEQVYLDINQESAGTRRLIMMLTPVFKALDEGGIVVIDELDASLHTQACEAVIALFSSRETNPKGAQLIATTHDTNVLNSEYVRRDQVWFCEKGDSGDTIVYPLTDIKTRGSDNIERGYLQGRFGAVPYVGPPLFAVKWRESKDEGL